MLIMAIMAAFQARLSSLDEKLTEAFAHFKSAVYIRLTMRNEAIISTIVPIIIQVKEEVTENFRELERNCVQLMAFPQNSNVLSVPLESKQQTGSTSVKRAVKRKKRHTANVMEEGRLYTSLTQSAYSDSTREHLVATKVRSAPSAMLPSLDSSGTSAANPSVLLLMFAAKAGLHVALLPGDLSDYPRAPQTKDYDSYPLPMHIPSEPIVLTTKKKGKKADSKRNGADDDFDENDDAVLVSSKPRKKTKARNHMETGDDDDN